MVSFRSLGARLVVFFVALLVLVQGLGAFLVSQSNSQIALQTIDQQLVKNYQFLVSAENDAERRAAVETTPARKIKEIRMALTLTRFPGLIAG